MANDFYWRALDAARHFISIGLVPLPSRMDKKKPTLASFACYQTRSVPKVVYDESTWRTTNIQLMTGTRTSGAIKIIVIDLDGPEAKEAWQKLIGQKGYKPFYPWIAESGSGGRHLYYQVAPDAGPIKTRMLWGLYDPFAGDDCKGGWVPRKEIRLLGDGSLVVAPPSRHVKTNGNYEWVGKYGPHALSLPEFAPDWLLAMPGVAAPERHHYDQGACPKNQSHGLDSRRNRILRALSPREKINLARTWGLRFTSSHPAIKEWIECRAIDRKDSTPSAGFNPSTGVYHEFGGDGRTLSFFDLAVSLGAYRSWTDAATAIEESITRTI